MYKKKFKLELNFDDDAGFTNLEVLVAFEPEYNKHTL